MGDQRWIKSKDTRNIATYPLPSANVVLGVKQQVEVRGSNISGIRLSKELLTALLSLTPTGGT
jgi:hypothetical protein